MKTLLCICLWAALMQICSCAPHQLGCWNSKGELHSHGNWYTPSHADPCQNCFCQNGKPHKCYHDKCDEPMCTGKPVPGVCCGWKCTDDQDSDNLLQACSDTLGLTFQEGEWYTPDSRDPCKSCVCHNGKPERCYYDQCNAPVCPGIPVLGVCCGWKCYDSCTDKDGTEVKHGQNFFPAADNPCKSCQCENGNAILCDTMPCAEPSDPNCLEFRHIIGTCCDYYCAVEQLSVEDGLQKRDTETDKGCIDRKSNEVAHGATYLPYSDPCMKCTCHDGRPVGCRAPRCIPPQCDWELSEDECCVFSCDGIKSEPGKSCIDRKGIEVEHGMYYKPKKDDSCFECECRDGLPQNCITAACMPPPCKKYKTNPDKCCSFTCIEEETRGCVDGDGKSIKHNDLFHPDKNACKRCICKNGKAERCSTAHCMPPSCDYEQLDDGCCSYMCDGVKSGPGKDCVDRKGNDVRHGSMYYSDKSDPCMFCECRDGLPYNCMLPGCRPPPCDNFKSVEDACCEYECIP